MANQKMDSISQRLKPLGPSGCETGGVSCDAGALLRLCRLFIVSYFHIVVVEPSLRNLSSGACFGVEEKCKQETGNWCGRSGIAVCGEMKIVPFAGDEALPEPAIQWAVSQLCNVWIQREHMIQRCRT